MNTHPELARLLAATKTKEMRPPSCAAGPVPSRSRSKVRILRVRKLRRHAAAKPRLVQ
jgi:hypothetical protein